jgi:DNA uptake protein ComE-like DNA-binding protein
MMFESVQMLVVLNTASAEQLMELHGIGVKRTQAIIETRQEGPFMYVLQYIASSTASNVYVL